MLFAKVEIIVVWEGLATNHANLFPVLSFLGPSYELSFNTPRSRVLLSSAVWMACYG